MHVQYNNFLNRKLTIVTDPQNSSAIYKYSHELYQLLSKKTKTLALKRLRLPSLRHSSETTYFYQLSNGNRPMLLDILLNGQDMIVTLHDILPRNRYLKVFIPRILKVALSRKNVLGIFVHSAAAKQLVKDLFGDQLLQKTYVVPFVLFLPDNSNSPDKVPEEYKNMVSSRDLLCVGFMTEQKGIETTIEAFKASKLAENGSRLFILGKFSSREYFKKVMAARDGLDEIVVIDQFIPDSVLNHLLKNIGVILTHKLFSKGESSGIVSNAILHEKPILISSIDNSKEYLKVSECVVETGNTAQFTNKLRRLILDEGYYDAIKRQISARRDMLDLKNLLKQYVDVFSKL